MVDSVGNDKTADDSRRRQQLVQDRLVSSYIADARVRQFFRPTLADPGYEMTTENRYFVADDGIDYAASCGTP